MHLKFLILLSLWTFSFLYSINCFSDVTDDALCQPSLTLREYVKKDCLIYDLHGPVKSCTVRIDNTGMAYPYEYTIEFNSDGSRKNENPNFKISRDSENRIIDTYWSYSHPITDESCIEYTLYSYSSPSHNDWITYEECFTIYNHDGNERVENCTSFFTRSEAGLIIMVAKVYDDIADQVTIYTYTTFDEEGNWTKRSYKDPVTQVPVIEERTISYY